MIGFSLCVVAGTIVDRGVTHPTETDFFLFSQAGLKGTSRPAHYHTLLDQNGLTADQVQQFSYQCDPPSQGECSITWDNACKGLCHPWRGLQQGTHTGLVIAPLANPTCRPLASSFRTRKAGIHLDLTDSATSPTRLARYLSDLPAPGSFQCANR